MTTTNAKTTPYRAWLLHLHFHKETLIKRAAAMLILTLTVSGLACGQVAIDLPQHSTQPSSIPKPVRVKNEAVVIVHVNGLSPLETCKLSDRKAIDIESKNALEELTKVLANFGAFGFGPGGAGSGPGGSMSGQQVLDLLVTPDVEEKAQKPY